MDKTLRFLFDAVANGRMAVDEALASAEQSLAERGFEDLGFAHVDHDRVERCGFAEVIFAAGKTPEQVVKIAHSLFRHSPVVLVTRVPEETARALHAEWPNAEHNRVARTVVVTYDSMMVAHKNIEIAIAEAGYAANGIQAVAQRKVAFALFGDLLR